MAARRDQRTGMWVRLMYAYYSVKGTLYFLHFCQDVMMDIDIPLPGYAWDEEEDTITPAITCKFCGMSGWYTAGKWIPKREDR